jgi:hypothetical protein
MEVAPSVAVVAASAVLALSKAAWKLGISLSRLDQDAETIDTTIQNLVGDVKSLGNECDLVYAEVEERVGKSDSGSLAQFDVDGALWNCLATQAEETNRTIQELQIFIEKSNREKFISTENALRQRKLTISKDEIAGTRINICRHTDNLRMTLPLIKL